jgi:hypothetical protein
VREKSGSSRYISTLLSPGCCRCTYHHFDAIENNDQKLLIIFGKRLLHANKLIRRIIFPTNELVGYDHLSLRDKTTDEDALFNLLT